MQQFYPLGKSSVRIKFLFILLILSNFLNSYAGDIKITGTVKDVKGNTLAGAAVSFTNGTSEFKATSAADGSYQVTIPFTGIGENSQVDIYSNAPNPFSERTYIPVNIHIPGTLLFTVYNLVGQKIREVSYNNVSPGIFYLQWDGTNQSGASVQTGLYIYQIIFAGKKYSGKMMKANFQAAPDGNGYIPDALLVSQRLKEAHAPDNLQFYAKVSRDGFYKINQVNASVKRDTVINFTLYPFNQLPYKTQGNYLTYWDEKTSAYKQVFLKGINLGTSPPGFTPGQVGYAILEEQYERWINRMGAMGFNSLRIYTLHPPVFYEKLAKYNEAHPEKPIYLFQGIWLEEDSTRYSHDLLKLTDDFNSNIEEVISCIHGNRSIAQRYGRAYGNYTVDVSQWVMAYIIGREISSIEVRNTNKFYPSNTSFSGPKISLTNASATETWLAARLDKVLTFEKNNYNQERPVSASSWPTLDPLKHYSEPDYTDEDNASFDLANLNLQNAPGGYFASFHAYPYFPNFMNEDSSYRKISDKYGPNSYLGYLNDLKNHYKNIPLVIAEFGVPSSWGSAHQSFSGMHHGGHTEAKQGEFNVRMLKNMKEANCAGGMMFAWMDEWFKKTWIVDLNETKSFKVKPTDAEGAPTKTLWLNVCSAEQNFGLIAFDPSNPLELLGYGIDKPTGFLSAIKAGYDDHFFHLEILLSASLKSSDTLWVAIDTYKFERGESVLPNKTTIANRAEFALQIPVTSDTANYYVTEAYDEFGLTSKFNDADTIKQLFKTVPSDGKPWNLMRWKNNSNPDEVQDIGKILMKKLNSTATTTNLHGVFVEQGKISIRIPWTMLYVSDPTRLEVVDGFISYNQGWSHLPVRAISDGIAVSVAKGSEVINTTTRYGWEDWYKILYPHKEREKDCVPFIEKGLLEISDTP